jgi:hypothetical protein
VRTEIPADKDFVASVKNLGILQPIRAVRNSDGALRVGTPPCVASQTIAMLQ